MTLIFVLLSLIIVKKLFLPFVDESFQKYRIFSCISPAQDFSVKICPNSETRKLADVKRGDEKRRKRKRTFLCIVFKIKSAVRNYWSLMFCLGALPDMFNEVPRILLWLARSWKPNLLFFCKWENISLVHVTANCFFCLKKVGWTKELCS